MTQLKDKVVWITGASSGIGEALAVAASAEGAKLILSARRQTELERVRQLCAHPANVALLPLDLTAFDAADAARRAAGFFGNVDVLVNNAGISQRSTVLDTGMEVYRRIFELDFFACVALTKALLPGMVARNRGHVVNLGSIAGEWPYPGGNVYGATKAFVHQFTLNLRADLLGTAIRVSNIEPGLCGGTEFSEVRFHGDAAKAAKIYENTQPLTAADIAETVHWIATLPAHVNINTLQLMPVCQANGALAVHRSAP